MKYKYLLALLFAGFMAVAMVQHAHAADLKCAILPSEICDAATASPGNSGNQLEKTGVFMLLMFVLNIMTALVGIAAVGALIYAGVLYSSAGGGNEQVAKSKKLITDTVIGIVVYALMFFALNWLIPGGIIN